MEKVNEIFEELKSLMGKTDAISENRREEIGLWIRANKDKKEVVDAYHKFMTEGLAEIETDVNRIRMQINTRYELLPIAYIAKHYFGKSRSWLYQRINGNKVRGRVYTLNDEQKAVFNLAVKEIAKEISAVKLL